MQTFNSISIYTTLIVIAYERVQNSLIGVFTDTRTGKLNPLLITPMQLRQELGFIRENLPTGLSLPEQLLDNTDMINLYNLMTAKARISPQQAIFNIKIPLITQETFEVFNVIPIPILNTRTFMIQNAAEILVVNLLRDHYYPLSKADFSKCLKGIDDAYICRQYKTLYHKSTGTHQCELELLNKHELPSSCKLKISKQVDNWTHLHNQNHWIYTFPNKTIANIVCGKSSFQQLLQGTGLLIFNANCVLRENMITISSHSQHRNIIRTSYASPIQLNASVFTPDLLKFENTSHDNITLTLPSKTTEELQHLQNLLQEMKQQQTLSKMESIEIHQFAVSYIALFLIIAGIAWMNVPTLKRFCKTGCGPRDHLPPKAEPPLPLPRTRSHFNFDPDN